MSKNKTYRFMFIMIALLFVGLLYRHAAVVFRDNIMFYMTPTEFLRDERRGVMTIGGLVEENTLSVLHDGSFVFTFTDGTSKIDVCYKGVLPAMFRENAGAVARGNIDESGTFIAKSILARHDEFYYPVTKH